MSKKMKPVPVNELKVGEVYRYRHGRWIGYEGVGEKVVVIKVDTESLYPARGYFLKKGAVDGDLRFADDELYPCRVRTGNKLSAAITNMANDHEERTNRVVALGSLISECRMFAGKGLAFTMIPMNTDEKETLLGFLLVVDDATLNEFLELKRYE